MSNKIKNNPLILKLKTEILSTLAKKNLNLDTNSHTERIQTYDEIVEFFGFGMGGFFKLLNTNPDYKVEFSVEVEYGIEGYSFCCRVFDYTSRMKFLLYHHNIDRFLEDLFLGKGFYISEINVIAWRIWDKRMCWSNFSSLDELKMKLGLLGVV